MASTGVRKLYFFDHFHYTTVASVFDNTTSYIWTSPTAAPYDAWDSTVSGVEDLGGNYIVPGASVVAASYLRCVETTIPTGSDKPRTISIDWAIDFNSKAVDAGIYFFAAGTNLSVSCYRVRQFATNIEIARLDATGAILWLQNISYSAGSGWNYYRLHFYPVDFELGDGETLVGNAGTFTIEAGTVPETKPLRGKALDPSPITGGAYFGIYTGAGSQPKVGQFVIGQDFYPMAQMGYVDQSLWQGAVARVYMRRGDYSAWDVWQKEDIIQIWVWDIDEDEDYYEYLDFTGELLFTWDILNGKTIGGHEVCCMMQTYQNRLKIPIDTTGSAGALTDITSQFLELAGGNHWAGLTDVWGFKKVVNSNFIKGGSVNVTVGRTFRGRSMNEILRHMALVEDFYLYTTPEGAIKLTDVWRDKTAITINTGSGDSRYLHHKIYEDDISTMTNEAHVHRSASVERTQSDATSKAAHGTRVHIDGRYIDRQVVDNAEADAIAQTIVNNHHEDLPVIGLFFLGRHTQLRPGDLVNLSCPQIGVGGDFETASGSWTPEEYSVLEKRYDSKTNVVFLKLTPTWDDGGNTKGYMDRMKMVKAHQSRSRYQAEIANSNQL